MNNLLHKGFLSLKKMTLFLILINFFTLTVHANGKPKYLKRNVLTMEQVQLQADEFDQQMIDFFRDYHFIFVRGIFANIYDFLNRTMKWTSMVDPESGFLTWYHQLEYFKKIKLSYEDLEIVPEKHPDTIGRQIRDAVLRSTKKVILVTHSKGGVDTLHALVNYPEIKSMIGGWVSFQSPFKGSQLMEDMSRKWWLSPLRLFAWTLKGDKDVYYALSLKYRERFLEKNHKLIGEVLSHFPMYSLGTTFTIKRPKSFWQWKREIFQGKRPPVFNIFYNYLRQNSGPHDGLVALKNTCLEFMKCFSMEGIDHAGPVMNVQPFWTLPGDKRLDLTKWFLRELYYEIH